MCWYRVFLVLTPLIFFQHGMAWIVLMVKVVLDRHGHLPRHTFGLLFRDRSVRKVPCVEIVLLCIEILARSLGKVPGVVEPGREIEFFALARLEFDNAGPRIVPRNYSQPQRFRKPIWRYAPRYAAFTIIMPIAANKTSSLKFS